MEYFAFGGTFVEEHSNTHRTPYLFNGKELDEETGLYYYGARYYDAQVSVWMSVDPKASSFPHVSPYNAFLNNPLIMIDPNGDSTFVQSNFDGTYTVTGGSLAGDDRGIYIQNAEGNLTGDKLGESLTTHSFVDAEGNFVLGAVIDPNSMEGQDFINEEIIEGNPGLFHYMINATGGETYDFKAREMNERPENMTQAQYHYRGMLFNGKIASARDIGNYAAGYVAGIKGFSCGGSRVAFDALESFQQGSLSTEAQTTQRAQRAGHNVGYPIYRQRKFKEWQKWKKAANYWPIGLKQ